MGKGGKESIGVGLGPREKKEHGGGTLAFCSSESRRGAFKIVLLLVCQ